MCTVFNFSVQTWMVTFLLQQIYSDLLSRRSQHVSQSCAHTRSTSLSPVQTLRHCLILTRYYFIDKLQQNLQASDFIKIRLSVLEFLRYFGSVLCCAPLLRETGLRHIHFLPTLPVV